MDRLYYYWISEIIIIKTLFGEGVESFSGMKESSYYKKFISKFLGLIVYICEINVCLTCSKF